MMVNVSALKITSSSQARFKKAGTWVPRWGWGVLVGEVESSSPLEV